MVARLKIKAFTTMVHTWLHRSSDL